MAEERKERPKPGSAIRDMSRQLVEETRKQVNKRLLTPRPGPRRGGIR